MELLIQRDTATGSHHFYPGSRVPGTLSDTLELVRARRWRRNLQLHSDLPHDPPRVRAGLPLRPGHHQTRRGRPHDLPRRRRRHEQLHCGMRVRVQFGTVISGVLMPVFTADTLREKAS